MLIKQFKACLGFYKETSKCYRVEQIFTHDDQDHDDGVLKQSKFKHDSPKVQNIQNNSQRV